MVSDINKDEHSILGASSSDRWMNCPKSVKLSEGIESKSSPYAEEGSAAHAVGEMCLKEGIKDASDLVGAGINGYEHIEVTSEMTDAVQLYIDTVRADRESIKGKMAIEHKFDLEWVMPGMFGTLDCGIASKDLLIVTDYKHGKGVAVNVENNTQLMYYALGGIRDLAPSAKEVEMVIVQPRADHPDGPVRRWRMKTVDLFNWRLNTLLPAAQATQSPDAAIKVGKWCRWCPATAVCPEMADKALASAKADFATLEPSTPGEPDTIPITLPNPDHLGIEKVVKLLDFSEIMVAYNNELARYVQEQLEKGVEVPGYKLVKKRSNRTWNDEELAVAAIHTFFKNNGIDTKEFSLYKEPQILTPAVMEKFKLGKLKKDFKALIAEHNHKPDSGTTLARNSDKRQGVLPSAVSDFLKDDPLFKIE